MWNIEYLPTCGDCKAIWEEKGAPPPCDTCMVLPLPENEDAILIYMITRRQIIAMEVGEKRYFDANIVAITSVMETHNIRDKRSCLGKVLKLFHHFLKKELQ